ncbi:hypothetical protein [Pacificoceanicola onchidii]|uniref:hypothetical protein n=1 Tax=Pacificoceanicola onchidii TaxID=2562685 RepID=UPI001455E55C|nr:hypothetical protein [Pacificoceanicola onchidii]
MGFPYETSSWTDVSGPIFMGAGTSAPSIYAVIGLLICIGALAFGQAKESAKYAKYK